MVVDALGMKGAWASVVMVLIWLYQIILMSASEGLLPLAFQLEGVLSLPPCVHLSVCKLYLVCTITRARFVLKSSNLHQTNMHHGILSAGIENGGHWPWPLRSFWLKILGNSAFRAFSCHRCGLETYIMCTKHTSCDTPSWLWKWRSLVLTFKGIDLDHQGHFGHVHNTYNRESLTWTQPQPTFLLLCHDRYVFHFNCHFWMEYSSHWRFLLPSG